MQEMRKSLRSNAQKQTDRYQSIFTRPLQARMMTRLNEGWLRRLWLSEKLCCYGGLKQLVRQMKSIRMTNTGRGR